MKTNAFLLVVGSLLCVALMASATTRYVNLNNPTPVSPYTNWLTAATSIQDAVDAAVASDVIWVTNGVYATGARAVYGMSNRVAVSKAVTVQSVNGPAVTTIAGYQVPDATNGVEAVRCVYLTNGAVLAGFTLTHGATQTSGDYYTNQYGGGVWSESATAMVSNCVLTGNSASSSGGGACGGTLNNCTLTSNWAYSSGGGASSGALNNCTLMGNSAQAGGGAHVSTLNNCTLTGNSARSGGGAYYGTLNKCTLTANSAQSGGGAYAGTFNNCTFTGNSAIGTYGYGGGAFSGTLNNCTITGNSAYWSGGGAGGGTLNNCIVYYNTASTGDNYLGDSTFNYSCTTPLPSGGIGNLTNAPLFMNTNGWSNLRLLSNSPCINAGNNAYVVGATDLDGRPRIVNGTVDIGAYEFQPSISGLFLAWLRYYGLPTDGSADYTDNDQDGMNNWQEWMAGTVPTDAASSLRLGCPVWGSSSATLTWSSVTNRSYALERATNPGAVQAFSLLCSNIAGLPGTTSFTDTNALGSAPRFYRVRVEN